jgi:hypothetical protein
LPEQSALYVTQVKPGAGEVQARRLTADEVDGIPEVVIPEDETLEDGTPGTRVAGNTARNTADRAAQKQVEPEELVVLSTSSLPSNQPKRYAGKKSGKWNTPVSIRKSPVRGVKIY